MADLPGFVSQPTWSPDGTRVAFTVSRLRVETLDVVADLYEVAADGSGLRRTATGFVRDPSYSPA